MSEIQVLQEAVTPFVSESLKNENIRDYKVEVTGKSEKGEGYAGEVVFVKVTGLNKSGENKEINLVIKMGKTNMREQFNIKEIYLREVRIYDKIFPSFKKFQENKGIQNPFNTVAKCYNTLISDDTEMVLLENLRKRGFEMHDRLIPMNIQHIQFILSQYSKFHAISFAMRDQNNFSFDNLTHNYTNMTKVVFSADFFETWFDQRFMKALDILKGCDDKLAQTFEKVAKDSRKFLNILDDQPEEFVITHGDCWNCNFMFKYENGNKETPSDVVILDWQLSSLHSPVFDLSYFIYIVSSEEQLSKFDELMSFYYEKFSDFLRELGSDPEKLFPFSTLMEHWDKYSFYGLTFVVTSLEMMLMDKDEVVSFDEVESAGDTEKLMKDWADKIKPKFQEKYNERLVSAVRHYCSRIQDV